MEPESSPGKKVRVEEARAVNEDCARGRPPKRKARIVCCMGFSIKTRGI